MRTIAAPVCLRGKRIFAPLVGGSDLSFRLLARKYGAEVTFTPMHIAERLQDDPANKKAVHRNSARFQFHPDDAPVILQVAGSRPEPIISLVNHPHFVGRIAGVDLNCGCPQRFALARGLGAGLLMDPSALVALAEAVAREIAYSLSVKMRVHPEGVDRTAAIIRELHARAAIYAVTIHGRTPAQKGHKRGRCDWETIAAIRRQLPPSLIVVGNGDVISAAAFVACRRDFGVDAVMVGYGALRDPRIFHTGPDPPPPLATVVEDYLEIATRNQDDLITIKRHLHWLVHTAFGPDRAARSELKRQLFACPSLQDVRLLIRGVVEAPTVSLGITTANPEMATANPEITTANPEMATANPETTTANPEMATANPEITTANPEMATANPETTTANPEMATANPEITTANPEIP